MKFKKILIIIFFIALGILTAIIFNNYFKEKKVTKSINQASEATVYIENYKNNVLISNGSGFIYKIDDKAYIITNNHVIENSDKIKVVNSDNNEVYAQIIGSDIYSDIAILSIDEKYAKKHIKLGNSDKLKLNDTIFAIGTPIDKENLNTVVSGTITGLNEKIKVTLSNGNYLINTIQMDALIKPGNSGGPVINKNGEVVGIVSMKLNNSDKISFAIPINDVKNIINELEKGKNIERPTIGLELINITNKDKLIENYISIDKNITHGVVVTDVYKNYSAHNAGLKIGDIIVDINGNKIDDMAYFKYYLYQNNIGDKIEVTYIRENKEQVVDLNL